MITAPTTREFTALRRGYARELILDYFRLGLLSVVNPDTGEAFTADEVARATSQGSRWYNEANAIDDLQQGQERKAMFLAQQGNPLTASTWWLEHVWGPMLAPEGRQSAGRAGGYLTVRAPSGTSIVGSTTVPDETAYWGYVGAVRVQVLVTSTVPSSGVATVSAVAIDAGTQGNFAGDGEVLTWSNRDPAMAPTATIDSEWSGGTATETDYEFAVRMVDSLAYKQGGGNDAQQRAWARRATLSVLEAFIYPCYSRANSFLVAVTQKRGTAVGPEALQPSEATLAEVTAQMVPPGAPDQPAIPMVVVTGFEAEPCDLAVHLAMAVGSSDGFYDAVPWPSHDDGPADLPPRVTIQGADYIRITAENEATLPGQSALATITEDFPAMVYWDEATSAWYDMPAIVSIEDLGSNVFEISFGTSLPSTLHFGAYVCPKFNPNSAIAAAKALQDYFDGLGPGELFAPTDIRSGRCLRFPPATDLSPWRAGTELGTVVREAIGGVASSSTVPYMSTTVPSYQTHFSDGPCKLTLGQVGIYPLT